MDNKNTKCKYERIVQYKAVIPRNSEIILELKSLENEALKRGDNNTSSRISHVIVQLLSLSNKL